MITYLLDTHVLLWMFFDSRRISKLAGNIIINPANTLFVSSVSLWEISIKYNSGKLRLGKFTPSDIPYLCKENSIECLLLDCITVSSFYQLSGDHHKDPFDRLLVWESIKNKYTLISDDENIKAYRENGLMVIW